MNQSKFTWNPTICAGVKYTKDKRCTGNEVAEKREWVTIRKIRLFLSRTLEINNLI